MKKPQLIEKVSNNFNPETMGLETPPQPQSMNGEVDLSISLQDGYLDFQGESDALFMLPRQRFQDVLDPESLAALSLSGSPTVTTDKVPDTEDAASINPTITPEMFKNRMEELFNNAYDPSTMAAIEKVGGDVAKRWRDQKIYDTVRGNPALKEYFTEFFPEYKQQLDDDAIASQVVMGVTPQGDPIRAGRYMKDSYTPNPAVVPRDILMPYDPERLDTMMKRRTARERDNRTLYAAVEAFGANMVDWAGSPKRRMFEMMSTYGSMVGATPQSVAEQYNEMFSQSPGNFVDNIPVSPTGLLFKLFSGRNTSRLLGDIPLLTDKQKKEATWESLAGLPGAKTMSDVMINEMAEFLGPGSGLKVAVPGISPEAAVQGPGSFRVGEGPSGTTETIGSMFIGMSAYRAAATMFNRAIVKSSDLFPVNKSKNAPIDYAKRNKALDAEANKASSMVGRTIANLKRAQVYNARYPGDVLFMESTLATGSVLAVEKFNKSPTVQAMFKDNPQGMFLASMGVGIFAPILAVVGANTGVAMANFPFRSITDQVFMTGYKDVAELLGDKNLNNKVGRKTVQALGRQLQTLKQEDKEAYDLLFSGFRAYREQKDTWRESLSSVMETKDIDDLLKYMDQAQSTGMTLALFDSARIAMQTSSEFGFGKIKRSTFGQLGMFRSQFEQDVSNLASVKMVEQQQMAAVKGYGEILERITNKYKELEDAPGIMRTTIDDMSEEYGKMLNVPQEKTDLLKDKMLQLYNISNRYNQSSSKLTNDTALAETRAVWESMGTEDRAIFSSVVKSQMESSGDNRAFGGFTDTLNKLDDIQDLIVADANAMEKVYTPLRDSGILDEDNNLAVKPPRLSRMQTPQFTIMTKVFNANKETSNGLYNEAYKDFEGPDGEELPAVNLATLVRDVEAHIQQQSLKYGTDGFKTAISVLTKLETQNPAVKTLIKLIQEDRTTAKRQEGMADPPEGKTYDENLPDQIKVDIENLTVREAAQIRSEIGSAAQRLGNGNTSEARKGSAVLMKFQEIFTDKIEEAVGPVGNANLKKANTYYRTNVASLFFDRYIRASLKATTNNPMPFRTAFNQTTNEPNVDLDTTLSDIDVEPSSEGRRGLYERYFPKGEKGSPEAALRAEADGLMRDLMLRRVFGNKGFKVDTATFVERLRGLADNESSPMFREFGDILGIDDNFIANSNSAPDVSIVNGAEVLSGNMRNTLQLQAAKSLVNDPFYSPTTMTANKEFVGDVFKETVRLLELGQRKDGTVSNTIGIFGKLAKEENREVIGNKLVEELFQFDGDSALNQYKGLIDDVNKAYGPQSKEAKAFEIGMRQIIVARMVEKSIAVKKIDRVRAEDPKGRTAKIEAVGAIAMQMEFQKHTGLYQEVFGEVDYDAIVSIIKVASKADNVVDVLRFGNDLNKMTESGALSRFWGVARGVVSLRYVGSEWLLRELASKKNEILVQVLSTPGLGQKVMDMVEAGQYSAYKPNRTTSQWVIPSLIGALSDGSEKEHTEAITALTNLYNVSVENNQDFILNLTSLAIAARNPELLAGLVKIQEEAKEMAGAVSAPDAENTTTQEQMMNLMPAKRQFMGGVSP